MSSTPAAMSSPGAPAIDGLVPVMELLHSAQDRRGYIGEDDINAIAGVAGLSPTELYGAITAYPRFRLEPGKAGEAVCVGPACRLCGAEAVLGGGSDRQETHCLGLCDQPVAVLTAAGPRLATYIGAAELRPTVRRKPIIGVPESAFFGDDDPIDAVRAARQRPPEELIAAITESGLQGRGGAGFPTGAKWSAVRAASDGRKFVVCNADESEPGSFKDRYILDNQPRRLLAGMAIAGHALGASAGVIYIRAEYRPQYEGLLEAIDGLRREGVLGGGFDIVVRRGGGLYVCGEETALLNSLEGRRPTPRDRPPYPTTHGLLGAPTLVQNVETLSAVPVIVTRGAAWYRGAGSPKLYCVSGDVPSPGVFELPMTITAQELFERAGVAADGVKAFTLGGLSGGLLPASLLAMQLDFATPRKHDAFLGSGGAIVANRSRCMVRFAAEAVHFYAGESCGKCFPCRIGTTRLRERLEAAVRFEEVDAGELRELTDVVVTGAACGLGPAAALVTRHLLAHFEDELEAHVRGRQCLAGECGRV
jgi:NADH:ubiquinone oxidoreductase subunit F (NADH-binding)